MTQYQLIQTCVTDQIKSILGTECIHSLTLPDQILISLEFFGAQRDLEYFLKTIRGTLDHHTATDTNWSVVAKRWRWNWLKCVGYPARVTRTQNRTLS